MRSRRQARLLSALTLLVVASFVACSLNPQPIPPGYTGEDNTAPPNAALGDASARGDATAGGAADASTGFDGGNQLADGAPPHDGDSGPIPTLDGGDAGDGSVEADASDDAAADAPSD